MTDNSDNVLDLSVKKSSTTNEVILKQNQNLSSLPSQIISSPSPSSTMDFIPIKSNKRTLDIPVNSTQKSHPTGPVSSNKRPLRFQCKHCDYKAPSTSLMQNHIYRHTDLTPYACAYCGHKSTTKSTIMVHIELCHPNMEVKIIENRVREQDFYRDLNSSEISNGNSSTIVQQESQTKKIRRANQYDSDSAPINGVAISLKTIDRDEDGNESSRASDEASEMENLEPILFDDDEQQSDLNIFDTPPTMAGPTLKLKCSPQQIPIVESTTSVSKEPETDDGSEYLLVYNRPKQYYGSLYEPDKQYACKLCSYTTNHRPSMEDHVFVHTNEKPYKCGYCGEEIYTRYAATYHIKYKHAGMPRNFIQNKADITQYYVNRAKKDDEKNQFKVIDTRRVKIPARNGKINQTKTIEPNCERTLNQHVSSPSPSQTVSSTSPQLTTSSSTNNSQSTNAPPDYRFLLAWSYYLASQAAWLSPMMQQNQGQLPSSLPTDPEMAAKFLQQAMQSVMDPMLSAQKPGHSENIDDDDADQTGTDLISQPLIAVKEESKDF